MTLLKTKKAQQGSKLDYTGLGIGFIDKAAKREPTKEEYFNPEVEKGITSGDPRLDFLYKNQWLYNVPVVSSIIKNKAEAVARNSYGRTNYDNLKDSEKKGFKNNYTGSHGSIDLVSQFFGKGNLPKARYTPTSDFNTFLPSFSAKRDFDAKPISRRNDDMKNLIGDVTNFNESKYGDFMKTKQNVYADYPMQASSIMGVDLGGYKSGMGWDKDANLPYVSVADSWDFYPKDYANLWSGSKETSPDYEKNRQLNVIQSTLLNKSGNPFKIYDRFYFDPSTREYIPDDSIQSIKNRRGLLKK